MMARRIFNIPTVEGRNSFAELERMSRQMHQLSEALVGGAGLRHIPARVFPALNISEDNDHYYLRAELPGIKPEDFNLEVNGRNLSISGERKIKTEGQQVRYHRREREAGKFSRVVQLPGDIDAKEIEANMVNGLLTVTISKSEAAKPRQITVH